MRSDIAHRTIFDRARIVSKNKKTGGAEESC